MRTPRPRHVLLLSTAIVAGVLAPVGPAVATEVDPPETVHVTVDELPTATVEDGVARSEAVAAEVPFSLLGLTLPDGADRAEVRTRDLEGAWSDWTELEVDLPGLDGPDPGTEEAANAARQVTEPLWVGGADAFQVRLDGELAEVEATLIDTEGHSESTVAKVVRHLTPKVTTPPAEANAGRPAIITRKQWGADETLRRGSPSYATPRFSVIHHTAGSNSYTREQSSSIMRSMYAYHTRTQGWSDLGYNLVVDKYGQVFEGRHGGVESGVVGAHAAGFNSGSIGVAVIGNYETVDIPSVALQRVADVVAWKYRVHGINAGATRTISAGGRTLNTTTAHRNVGSTACPGRNLYAKMGSLRTMIQARATVTTAPGAPTGVTATAGDARASVTWAAPASTGGAAITGYTVTASPGGKQATVAATARTATVTGLTNGTAHTFTVRATNSVGTSPASSPSAAVTPTAAATPAPPAVPRPTVGLPVPVVGDWNGDGRSQVGWFHNGWWSLPTGRDGATVRIRFGGKPDLPVVGDWNGNGRDGIGVVKDGQWRLRQTASEGTPQLSFAFGRATDLPVVGNWNGRGRDGVGVYRNGTWHLRQTPSAGTATVSFRYGGAADAPIVGDWNSDGRDGVGVVSNASWRLRTTATAGAPTSTFAYGRATDWPATGDFNRNGQDTPVVVRADRWLISNRVPAGPADVTLVYGPTATHLR